MLSLPWKPQRYSWFSRKNSLQQENGKLQTQMEIKQKNRDYQKVTDYTTSHTELINDQKKTDWYQQRC